MVDGLSIAIGVKIAEAIFAVAVEKGIIFGSRLSDPKKAKVALASACDIGIAAAIQICPELRSNFETPTFSEDIFGPHLSRMLTESNSGNYTHGLLKRYLEVFVPDTFISSQNAADSFGKVHLGASLQLAEEAFAELIETTISELEKSNHWQDHVRRLTGRETRRFQRQSAERNVELTEGVAFLVARIVPTRDQVRQIACNSRAGLKTQIDHIENRRLVRPEAQRLLDVVLNNPRGVTVLVGEAGAGKTTLLRGLIDPLVGNNVTVFVIRADKLQSSVQTTKDLALHLGHDGSFEELVDLAASEGPVVILVDQLDTICSVMSRDQGRMDAILSILDVFNLRKLDEVPKIHLVMSTRRFEAETDPRIRQHAGDPFNLALPSREEVQSLLQDLDIPNEGLGEELLELIRRPFLLSVFVQLVKNGMYPKEIGINILETAMRDPRFGAHQKEARQFLSALAGHISETEQLEVPLDVLRSQNELGFLAALSAGLVLAEGERVSFSHQGWLDDFQAQAIGNFAQVQSWCFANGNSLFHRVTLVRALERLRRVQRRDYDRAIFWLLTDRSVRPHLKHISLELVATQSRPTEYEIAGLKHIIANDLARSKQALSLLARHWPVWRNHFSSSLLDWYQNPSLIDACGILLRVEAPFQPDSVVSIMRSVWPLERQRRVGIWTLSDVTDWTEEVSKFVLEFAPFSVDGWVLNHIAARLLESGDLKNAVSVSTTNLPSREDLQESQRRRSDWRRHGCSKIAKAAPFEFLKATLNWFVDVVGPAPDDHSAYNRYLSSHALPFNWDDEIQEDPTIFGCVKVAMTSLASSDPDAFIAAVNKIQKSELAEVHEIICEGFAAGDQRLGDAALQYLLGDTRRFDVGDNSISVGIRTSTNVHGWSTMKLIHWLAKGLDNERLQTLKQAIQNWDPYRSEVHKTDGADTRRHRMIWAKEKRALRLRLLPREAFTPREHRQISEMKFDFPIEGLYQRRGGRTAGFVGSPMQHEAMAKAKNHHIVNMLNEIPDGAEYFARARGKRDGGVRQLAQSFGAFAKDQPERAMEIVVNHLEAGKHETVASDALKAFAANLEFNAEQTLRALDILVQKGFQSHDFCQGAAQCLQSIAHRQKGLSNQHIELLKTWIDPKAGTSARQIAKSKSGNENDSLSFLDTERTDNKLQSRLFGFGRGGGVIPQENYTFFDAMHDGLIEREPRDYEAWVDFLEQQLSADQSSTTWRAVISFQTASLYWAKKRIEAPARVETIIDRLLLDFPDAFDDATTPQGLWDCREFLTQLQLFKIIEIWRNSDEPRLNQIAGEFVGAMEVMNEFGGDLSDEKMGWSANQDFDNGRVLGASQLWTSDNEATCRLAHVKVMAAQHSNPLAFAASLKEFCDNRQAMQANDVTREILEALTHDKTLHRDCFGYSFFQSLNGLASKPGFARPVLGIVEAAIELFLDEVSVQKFARNEEDLTALTIFLQREGDEIGEKAMDLYELLLDAGVEDAAKATLRDLQR